MQDATQQLQSWKERCATAEKGMQQVQTVFTTLKISENKMREEIEPLLKQPGLLSRCIGSSPCFRSLALKLFLFVAAVDFHHLQRLLCCRSHGFWAIGLRTACCGHGPWVIDRSF